MIIPMKKIMRYIKYICLMLLGACGLFAIWDTAWITLVNFDIPDTKIINGSSILILNDLNFSSTYNNTTMNRVLYFPSVLSSNWRNRNFSLFTYYNWLPYLLTAYIHDWNISFSLQWFLQKVCVANAWEWLTYCWNDWVLNWLSFSRLNSDDISVFLNANWFSHWYFWRWEWWESYAPNIYCFSNDINDYCFVWNASNTYLHTNLSGSLSLNNWSPDYINTFNWSASPFNLTNRIPWYEIWQREMTNWDILFWFFELWLTEPYCYWWFDKTDLFSQWSQEFDYNGYEYWSWMFITNMYEEYWSNYSNPLNFLGSLRSNYLNNNYSNFYWKSKSLYGFTSQYFDNREDLQFDFSDIWDMCELYTWIIHWTIDEDAIYTWWNKNAINSANNNMTWGSNKWWFNLSWVLNNFWTWNSWAFANPDDFFWKISVYFTNALNKNIWDYPMVLPSYIIYFMLAIIFIRLISRSNG